VGHDHLDGGRRVAALPLGSSRTSTILYLGVARDGIATEHHRDELGETMNP